MKCISWTTQLILSFHNFLSVQCELIYFFLNTQITDLGKRNKWKCYFESYFYTYSTNCIYPQQKWLSDRGSDVISTNMASYTFLMDVGNATVCSFLKININKASLMLLIYVKTRCEFAWVVHAYIIKYIYIYILIKE